jgi:hypothetical protein
VAKEIPLTITDDNAGTITASVDGKVVRKWHYPNWGNDDPMGLVREFVEGWRMAMQHKPQHP